MTHTTATWRFSYSISRTQGTLLPRVDARAKNPIHQICDGAIEVATKSKIKESLTRVDELTIELDCCTLHRGRSVIRRMDDAEPGSGPRVVLTRIVQKAARAVQCAIRATDCLIGGCIPNSISDWDLRQAGCAGTHVALADGAGSSPSHIRALCLAAPTNIGEHESGTRVAADPINLISVC